MPERYVESTARVYSHLAEIRCPLRIITDSTSCRYHVVFAPKYRKKVIYGRLRRELGGIIRQLCEQNKIEIIEGHAMIDHVHLCLSIPPKYSVANTVGFIKGKSAIRIHREHLGRRRNFTGFHFWARGYCVSTVGLDEQTIRDYIRHQEEKEKREEQLVLMAPRGPSHGS